MAVSGIIINIILFIQVAILWALQPFMYILKLLASIQKRFKCENDMRGKVALITGASSGIGEQLAYEYAKRGARLVIVARREILLKKVAENARKIGSPEVIHICADVCKADDCRSFVEETVNHFGRLDHVVNNAGATCLGLIEEATYEDITKFAELMNLNFWGSIYPTYFAIPHLKRTKGSIFVNASAMAILNPPGLSVYAASKAALLSFYDTMTVELAPEISVTTAALGLIDSEMTQGKQLPMDRAIDYKSFLKYCCMGGAPVMRVGDCAEAIVRAICRKERCVTEPQWWKLFFRFKFWCPELTELAYLFMCQRMKKHKTNKNTNYNE